MRRPSLLPLVALLIAARLDAQQPASEPPDPAPLTAPLLLVVQEVLLPNGLKLVVLEQHRQPIVSLTLSLPAGSAYEPDRKEGLADMLAALMTRGAGRRSGAEVAELVESVGGSFSAAADPDAITIQADLLSSHTALGFELISDAVLRPALDSQEIALFSAQAASNLASSFEDPATVAGRVFLTTSYRGHPYGRRALPQSVASVRRGDIVAYLKSRVRPAGSVLVVAGDVTLAEARRLALASFGTWTGLRPAALPPVTLAPPQPVILLVHAGGIRSANIVVGNVTFTGADSAYYAAMVLSRILGDDRRGRLGRALNIEHSWSTLTGASFLRSAGRGLFQATTTIATEDADSAVRVIYDELRRLRTDTVPQLELQRARESVSGGFAVRLQTVGQLGRAFTETRQLGLPSSYLTTYRKRILGVSATQVRALARRIFPATGTITVVVGDAARLYQPLSRIGPVAIFSVDGRRLTPEAIQPRAAPLVFDVSRGVTARSDSLAILTEGKTVGLQVTRLSRDGDSLTYIEETALGNAISQSTRLTFDTAGRMRGLEQVGKVRGQDTRIQLSYGLGRVRGSATTAGPNGPRTVAVDTAVSTAIIDDNAIPALLPLLKWELNIRWTLQVFASGENRIRTMTLTAADLTRVAVPAGEFECFRADLDGGPQRVSFYVTSTPPHRLIRVELPGSTFEFVAVNP
jgi:zinc protease